ncbi:MAG: type I-MYXAN CRISPR-associated protein Cas6/Cmx6 [Alphaproteobacteria bacterium]|nr:type I-MYXAN CRISPR-associated protein Cas6/Cmx6 [Alphaproteobacteria bacterium]
MTSRYWNDDEDDEAASGNSAAADLAFALSGRAIPADYAFALSHAVIRLLPWLPLVQGAGLHLVYGAESGNGWQRDETDGALLYLPRRARLVLRLPEERLEDTRALVGQTLDVRDFPLRVGEPSVQPLSPSDTTYARHVVDETGDEDTFLERAAQAIDALGFVRRKIMCGKSRRISTPGGEISTRSMMVAGLAPRDSLTLLERGIGSGRLMGCGLFVPYKRPNSVARGEDD